MSVEDANPLVAVIMGSQSDWDVMSRTHAVLHEFGVPHECKVLSAHRTPEQTAEYVKAGEVRGIEVFIAGAGMAAALPGTVAAFTTAPVLGVPVASGALDGLDALLAMVQMPPGIPVGTMAIGKAGATNAALFAVAILAGKNPEYGEKLKAYRAAQAKKVLDTTLPCEE